MVALRVLAHAAFAALLSLPLGAGCGQIEEDPPSDSGAPRASGGSGNAPEGSGGSGGGTGGFPFWYPELTHFTGDASRVVGLPDGSIVLASDLSGGDLVCEGYLERLTPDGQVGWTLRLPGACGLRLALDDRDRVVVAARFRGELRVGDFSLESTVNPGAPDPWGNGPDGRPSADLLLLRLDSKGEPELLRALGGIGDQDVAHLLRDRSGRLHLVGRFSGRLQADGYDEEASIDYARGHFNEPDFDRFVLRLDEDLKIEHLLNRGPGGRTLSAQFTSSGALLVFNDAAITPDILTHHLALIDPESNAILWRLELQTCPSARFDVGPDDTIALALPYCLVARDTYESRILFLSSEGEVVAEHRWGTSAANAPYAVLALDDGFVVTGQLDEAVDFGAGLLAPGEHHPYQGLLPSDGVYERRQNGPRGAPLVVSYDPQGKVLHAELGQGEGWGESVVQLASGGFVVGGAIAIRSPTAIDFAGRRTHFSMSSFVTWFPDFP